MAWPSREPHPLEHYPTVRAWLAAWSGRGYWFRDLPEPARHCYARLDCLLSCGRGAAGAAFSALVRADEHAAWPLEAPWAWPDDPPAPYYGSGLAGFRAAFDARSPSPIELCHRRFLEDLKDREA